MVYLIAYDISNNTDRTRAHRFLLGWGRKIQKSLFECDLNPNEISQVANRLHNIINPETDRLHIYRHCADCCVHTTILGSSIESALPKMVII